jgi:predicted TPR repeat methyltransferase
MNSNPSQLKTGVSPAASSHCALENAPRIYPPRNCPVCGGAGQRQLFRQSFGSLSQGSLLTGFDLVVCAGCGAGYADDVPGQDVFDRYYAEMSKYEYADRAGVQTETDLSRFREVADLVAPHLKHAHRLLDIGCATGGLLAEFKRRGFVNLLGVDPSAACAKLTEQLYDIPAKALSISTLDQLREPVDVAFLTGVLEHIRDVDASLDSVKSCLSEGGYIYFEVPDATRYDHHFSAPFQLFSMEHVNYFSPTSLSNLMVRHGFSVVFTKRLIRHLSPQAIEPAIGALYRRDSVSKKNASLGRDNETEKALEQYIQKSRNLEEKIQEKISALVNAAKPLAVWGTGTHTLRLLETSRLLQAKIVCFIDSNVHYQGKTLAGIPIVAPSAISNLDAEILISSQTAEHEIHQVITEKLCWSGVIHQLYGG